MKEEKIDTIPYAGRSLGDSCSERDLMKTEKKVQIASVDSRFVCHFRERERESESVREKKGESDSERVREIQREEGRWGV